MKKGIQVLDCPTHEDMIQDIFFSSGQQCSSPLSFLSYVKKEENYTFNLIYFSPFINKFYKISNIILKLYIYFHYIFKS